MLAPLRALVEAIRARDPRPRYFFVGDYVNRGPQTRGVIDLLLDLPDSRFLRGNHDDVLDLILSGTGYVEQHAPADPVHAFGWFLQFGLDKTLASYGVSPRDIERFRRHPGEQTVRVATAAIPAAHREFIHRLEPLIEEPDLFVAHASWPVIDPTDEKMAERLSGSAELRHRLIWGRFTLTEIIEPKSWSRPGFFGHTPVPNYAELLGGLDNVPAIGPQITLLDTGAALGPQGRLTAWCVEQKSFIQADPASNMIGPVPGS